MRLLNILLRAALILLCLGVALGFAGAVHPAFDSLSLLRLPLAVLCLAALVFGMGAWLRLLLLASAVAGLVTTVPLHFGGHDGQAGDGLRIYSKNLLYDNAGLALVAEDIRQSGASVVMLQEVRRLRGGILGDLSESYPYQHFCRFPGGTAVAVLSRWPIRDRLCARGGVLAAALIDTDAGTVWAGAVYLPWPFPYGNAEAADAAVEVLEALDGPVVLAGDFNIFPWANSVRRIQRTAGLKPALPIRPTFDLYGVPLFLDHVHAPDGGAVRYRPALGSDHLGVVADVVLRR
ncbi:MAG: endonuclease/exonuclease/phosphatase family protein [Yoonia sp.]|uniref:endonuclease/exonuclease/phosphatase family protein n=1 Tax=Yoonia sp. TaxID=2212373 RepID=UPI003EF777C6